jgi:branched-chain amino acid transport system permease protein
MNVVQFIVTGILVGGVYALISSGLGLIFGVMRIVNFAQADFMMLAMFATYVFWAGPRINPMLAIPVVFFLFLIIGMIVYRFLVGPVAGRRENQDAQVIVTLGIGLILQNAMLLTFGSAPRLLTVPRLEFGFNLGPIFIDGPRFLGFVVAGIVAAGLYYFLQRTALGRAIRASSENWEAATYMGINLQRTYGIAFGIGLGLTAIGGAALAVYQPVGPFVGLNFTVIMFAAVVLGGLGSIPGAFVGGIVIGVIQSVAQVWSPSTLSNVYVFGIFLLVLLLRPQGLFGRKQRAI